MDPASLFRGCRIYYCKERLRSNAIIERVKKIIDRNFMILLNLYSISNELQLSPNYFSVIFREITGENISYYITNRRIEKACMLLKYQEIAINNVALKVGYIDSHYFAKVFKKM